MGRGQMREEHTDMPIRILLVFSGVPGWGAASGGRHDRQKYRYRGFLNL